MKYQGLELLFLFFLYSFVGWILETIVAATKQKRFVNRGLINGPICSIYGVGAVAMSIGLRGLSGGWLFVGAMIYGTVIEWIAGHWIEKLFQEKWWDYSKARWNLDGYICAYAAIIWGTLGFFITTWGNRWFLKIYHVFPKFITTILLWSVAALIIVDALASFMLLLGKSKRLHRWEEANIPFVKLSGKFSAWIVAGVERRIQKAYPAAKRLEDEILERTDENKPFAYGCGFYKLVLLLMIGAFLGDIIETIFCRLTMGSWMSRSGVVWGQFSFVWGVALAMITALLYKYKDRGDSFLFLVGTLLGGTYEYLCSVLSEIVFGKVFWDYSHMAFNLGGRINLLYCFFWGIVTVIWFKYLYPWFSNTIEKIPKKIGILVTWLMILFIIPDLGVSYAALTRYNQRERGIEAVKPWQKSMDRHFDDAEMERIYPKAKSTITNTSKK
ncbi:MAG: putative ABC transporter permease [Anaerostipes sp.]|nr:putative ABC transporter permease [Anaerostipes sp.]